MTKLPTTMMNFRDKWDNQFRQSKTQSRLDKATMAYFRAKFMALHLEDDLPDVKKLRDGNPYVDALCVAGEMTNEEFADWAESDWLSRSAKLELRMGMFAYRTEFVKLFSWAIPNQVAIDKLVELSPLIEIGAGTGYWAWMVRNSGGKVKAYDAMMGAKPFWHNVSFGNERSARTKRGSLFLCWPDYATPVAFNALRMYRGDTVCYVGEGHGGCTGDDAFHERLETDWELTDQITIPQYDGIHDRLEIWKRQSKSKKKFWTYYGV